MKFVEFKHQLSGTSIMVNVEHIIYIQRISFNSSRITTVDGKHLDVLGTSSEIMYKVNK